MLCIYLPFFLGLCSTRISGAHGRYGTGDWTYLQCREYLMSVWSHVVEFSNSFFLINRDECMPNLKELYLQEKDKRRAFLKICNNFRYFLDLYFHLPITWYVLRCKMRTWKVILSPSLSLITRPVMHHFFLERFLLPADWFQSRLAYTRSVAASSMVNYCSFLKMQLTALSQMNTNY